jgi:hypothetical protein
MSYASARHVRCSDASSAGEVMMMFDHLTEGRDLLDGAAALSRARDYTGAVTRARAAVILLDRSHRVGALADDAVLALTRYEALEHAWRQAVQMRSATHVGRERALIS